MWGYDGMGMLDERIGLILSSAACNRNSDAHTVRLGLYAEVVEALSAQTLELHEATSGALMPYRLQLGRHQGTPGTAFLLAFEPEPLADALFYLPHDSCPIPGMVQELKAWVDSIKAKPLRTFTIAVLQRRDVYEAFWTMPASLRDHHSFRGGLAAHSLEVASDLASHAGITELERELGLVGGLLHDIGKVWSYTSDMFPNTAGMAMGHELVGLSRLEPQLQKLEQEWADGAYVMRSLLSGNAWKRGNGSLPSSLLPRIKACDQRSCERDMASRASRRHGRPVWTPTPFKAPSGSRSSEED